MSGVDSGAFECCQTVQVNLRFPIMWRWIRATVMFQDMVDINQRVVLMVQQMTEGFHVRAAPPPHQKPQPKQSGVTTTTALQPSDVGDCGRWNISVDVTRQ